MLSRSIRSGAKLTQARRAKAQTLASLDHSASLTSNKDVPSKISTTRILSASSVNHECKGIVNTVMEADVEGVTKIIKDMMLQSRVNLSLHECPRNYIGTYNNNNPKKVSMSRDALTSLKLAQDEFPEMSEIFYSTMRNILLRSNTNFVSSNVFSLGKNSHIYSPSSSSFHQGHHHNYNIYDGHRNMMPQARHFSSTPDGNNKGKAKAKFPVEQPLHMKAKNALDKSQTLALNAIKSLVKMIGKTPGVMYYYTTHPKEFKEKLTELKELAKKEAHHYYMGSKLLVADVRTAKQIVTQTLNGSPLSRRERKQLLRTVTDVFRLVPMSIFVLIPFMEFALPLALKIFPNMLPSTFQDSLKAEENMKRELKSRLAMAEFFQETLQDLAKVQKKKAKSHKKAIVANDGSTAEIESTENREETAASFLEFIEKARNGEFLPPEVIVKYAKYFKDELTLDNMPRMQLINMCRYMSIPPYGNDNVLRFQLRHKVRGLIEDDQRILWEGIESLTKMELREACQERGMRSTGLSKEAYKRALQQWIDLSVNRNVPISLLVMSRTFFLQEEMISGSVSGEDVTGLADAISGLDKELVNEVILESVSSDNKIDPELLKLKLEVLEAQNELIEEEKQQRDAEVAKAEKEKAEKEAKLEEIQDVLSVEEIASPVESSTPAGTIISKEEFVISDSESEPLKVEKGKKAGETRMEETSESEEDEHEEEEPSLSSEELDAISQLVSPDPVSAEREKLQSLKAALQEEEEEKERELPEVEEEGDSKSGLVNADSKESTQAASSMSSKEITVDNADEKAGKLISAMDKRVEEESEAATQISFDGEIDAEGKAIALRQEEEVQEEAAISRDQKLDMAVSRLKSKVESMVGNLEIQLSDVEAKIGDKLHFLDKDMDGILSREEMAICLQSVLKRPLTVDEAMAIAADMDENEDGLFSLDELSKWVETNKLVKLVEEGRDAEVDKIIETQAAKMREEDQKEGDK